MPKVTIITAAYNRSNVLRFAVKSVLRQSFKDWEYIVIGDHCTDDTESVMAEFNDERIYFENLPNNSGGQSTPHNCALAKAQGEYIFYLNQDDLFFPDHIESSLEFLEKSNADLIWTLVASPDPDGRNSTNWQDQKVFLAGMPPNGKFSPETFVITSSWALRREAAEKIGPWRHANESYLLPSQELLYRAWKLGCNMQLHPRVSVVCIHAGYRRNSYATRDFREQERFFNLIFKDPQGVQILRDHVRASVEAHDTGQKQAGIAKAARTVLRRFLFGAFRFVGVHPHAVLAAIRHRNFGGKIAEHRSVVIEVPRVRRGDVIDMGTGVADPFLGAGWAEPNNNERSILADQGLLAFRLDTTDRPQKMLLRGWASSALTLEINLSDPHIYRSTHAAGEITADTHLPAEGDLFSVSLGVRYSVSVGNDDTLRNGIVRQFALRKIEFQ